MPIWESSRHGLANTRQIRSKASPLTRTRLLINIHQSHVHRCGSLSSKECVSKGMRALFTPCWIISPPPLPFKKKQICRLRCVFKRCHFICTSYRRVTFSLSLSLKTVHALHGLKTIQNFFRNPPQWSPNKCWHSAGTFTFYTLSKASSAERKPFLDDIDAKWWSCITLFKTQDPGNHTLFSGTYPFGPNEEVLTPLPRPEKQNEAKMLQTLVL